MKRIGRHCVAVVWQDNLKEDRGPSGGIVFSGFVVALGAHVLLVTAGHVIEVVQDRQQAGRRLVGARIYDAWTLKPVTKDGVVFADIGTTAQGFEHSEDLGLDFAWFILRTHHVELLKANNIVPLTEAAWGNPPPFEQCVGFNCFGFPDDINGERRDEAGKFIGMRLKPRLIPYQPATPGSGLLKTKHPRMFFMPGGGKDGTVPELTGMSGGPVFGYAKQGEDLRYWLLGVQSGQANDPPRVATVCPFAPLAERIAKEVAQAEEAARTSKERA